MTTGTFHYATAQTGTVLVSATTDRVIRIHRLIVTGWVGAWVQLLSDPKGGAELALTARLRITNGSVGVFDFADRFAIATQRSMALGLTTVYQGAPSELGLTLWYDKVA